MTLSTQIALSCDGILIHASILAHAIEANGFVSEDSYEAAELDAAERRLRSLADKLGEQRKRLAANAQPMRLVAAE